ncbi:MAG: flagellar hook-associated protein 3 [Pseudomonas sp.]|uniref:flagellar hook-associated protein 3 n=1 Tax=Pseudomonas abieticivorans TaxID=2931382 RepID=UPI0020BE9EE8|nr:flagellar hook-associated protein 3 [Pseudomonas sp. PIA16]MDE1164331.1 flagellar hook-associated protein 3 [Pseudomonas sp.]
MRISTSQYFETSASNYSSAFAQTAKTQEQISSGVRIKTAGDDPVGAAKLLQLQQQSSLLTQYSTNMSTTTNSLNNQESVLSSVNNALQRAQELAVNAGDGSLTDADRQSIGAEISQLQDQVLGLLNTKDASGYYMFSGSKSTTPPYVKNSDGSYTYQGDQTALSLQVSDTLSLPTGVTGYSAFEQATNTSRTQSTVTSPAVNDNKVSISPGQMDSEASYNKSFTKGEPYTVNFTSDTTYTITDTGGNNITSEVAGNGTFDPTAEGGSTISLRGVDFTLKVDSANTGTTAGHSITLQSTPDTLTATRSAVNGSTAQITSSSITNQAAYNSAFPSSGAVIKFTSDTGDYSVYAQPYTTDSKAIATGNTGGTGGTVTAAGASFDISGTAKSGDTFQVSVNAHKTQSVLDTLSQLATALNTPINGDNTQLLAMQNSVTSAIANLSKASEQVDKARGVIGATGNAITIQTTENTSLGLANKTTQSDIGDTDMATASINLTLQQTMLEASQAAFAKIAQLSLFNKI